MSAGSSAKELASSGLLIGMRRFLETRFAVDGTVYVLNFTVRPTEKHAVGTLSVEHVCTQYARNSDFNNEGVTLIRVTP